MKDEDDMNIKIQNSGADGASNTKGSCSDLAHYIDHEDQERLAAGLEPLPYTTPDGDEVTTEEVIAAIDANTKGLSLSADKFFHLVVSPSQDEIRAMGSTDEEVYESGLKLIKAISDAYAENFHRAGLLDSASLELYWKPHFTRGNDGELQFHIHGVVSRKTKRLEGLGGKQLKVSPLTNHKDTVDGAVKGGFDRKTFFRKCEKLFDKLFHYDRKVAETFDFNNAMKHGTLEEKSEQTKLLAEENAEDLKTSISAGINRRRKNLSNKHDIDEIAALLEGGKSIVISQKEKKAIPDALNQADMKNDISRAFEATDKAADLFIELACMGISCRKRTSADGVESLDFYMGGVQYSSLVIFTETEHRSLLERFCTITHLTPAFRTREIQAELKAKKEQETAQHKIGGCKLRRH